MKSSLVLKKKTELNRVFPDYYIFKDGKCIKATGEEYETNENSCSCPSQKECKHQKMLRGEYKLAGEISSSIQMALHDVSYILKLSRPPILPYKNIQSMSIEIKGNINLLYVGIKGKFVFYCKESING